MSGADMDTAVDVAAIQDNLREYLMNICSVILNVQSYQVERELQSPDSVNILTQFISNADIMVIFVSKAEVDPDASQNSKLTYK